MLLLSRKMIPTQRTMPESQNNNQKISKMKSYDDGRCSAGIIYQIPVTLPTWYWLYGRVLLIENNVWLLLC